MANKHVHKLKRVNYRNGEKIYFCTLDCDYKVNAKVALGKPCQCWICGKAFNLTEKSLRLVKPHCNECTKTKGVAISLDEIMSQRNTSSDGDGTKQGPVEIDRSLRDRLIKSIDMATHSNIDDKGLLKPPEDQDEESISENEDDIL